MIIPVDIDNFIIDSINYKLGKYITIDGNFNKIPKEIGNCSSLKYIFIFYSQIIDISALSNLTSLKCLDLSHNKIVDISALSNLAALKALYLEYNKVVDVSPLSNLACLECLNLYNNKIKNKIIFNPQVRVHY